MENLPIYIGLVFGFTTFLSVILFYKATGNSRMTLQILLAWLTVQTVIGISGFYTVSSGFPPRFLFLLPPPFLFIIALFTTTKGKQYLDTLDIKTLTLLHTIRIPVEFVLFWLFVHKTVPELMTFEGRNLDILSGLSAPFIYYFGYVKRIFSNKILLLWNFICLALLLNIVINAILSAPFPFQQFAFEQPNIAVLYFPFNWLPSCVVPLVLLSHLTAIRQIINEKNK
jgi:hypothetical protein